MKKVSLILVAVLGIALLSIAITGPALAADLDLDRSGSGNSRGTRGGAGNTSAMGTAEGVPVHQEIQLDGALEDLLHENIAEGLGISLEELETRLEAGETVSEIGLSLELDQEAIREILSQAWEEALAEAVVTGILTQEQADWLASRGSRNLSGYGLCDETECTQGTNRRGSFQRKGNGQ